MRSLDCENTSSVTFAMTRHVAKYLLTKTFLHDTQRNDKAETSSKLYDLGIVASVFRVGTLQSFAKANINSGESGRLTPAGGPPLSG
jgi:hypothetical protein